MTLLPAFIFGAIKLLTNLDLELEVLMWLGR
jgi:hypothetical protein